MQPYISTSASTIGRVVNWDFYSYFRKRGGNWLRRDNSIVWKLSLKNFRCNAFFHNCQMYCVLSVSVVSLGKSALIFNNFLFFSMALNVLPKSPQAGPFLPSHRLELTVDWNTRTEPCEIPFHGFKSFRAIPNFNLVIDISFNSSVNLLFLKIYSTVNWG